jgi:hypothetical protein
MGYPKVKFRVDADRDFENYRLFLKYAPQRFVPMFLPPDLQNLLVGVTSAKKRRELVKAYIEDGFRKNRKRIRNNVSAVERTWRSKEQGYFKLMDVVFGGYPWPRGKYEGYASVFSMYPRDVADKTFHFSAFDSGHAVATTSHELMHFIFFDYVRRHYGLKEGDRVPGHGPNYLWNVSEVFNAVIEGWGPYRKMFGTSGETYDYMNRRMLPRMKRLWRERQDVDWLLGQYFGKPLG